MSEILQTISSTIIEGQVGQIQTQIQQALDEGIAADIILHEALIPAMAEVGQLYEEGEYFVPEMLVAARTMQSGLELLRPLLVASGAQATGKAIVGTVKGDLHDIGKNLVAMMLEGAGFDVVDLGTDVAPEAFVSAVRDHDADLVCMSALLTTTMRSMDATMTAFREAGLEEKVAILVGGAPVTAAYADQIGADGYAPDANQAVRLAKQLIGA